MKILLLDIETAPNQAYVWGLWKQNINIDWILNSGYVLCWSAKWLGKKKVMFSSIHKHGEVEMLEQIHQLLDEADAVVHYNGEKFDMPTLHREFVLNEMKPPAPYKNIDLLKVVRSEFKFPSNKLDYVANELGIGTKVRHSGPEMWIGCMNGDVKCWREMEKYNKQDVILLEDLYSKLLPWIRVHPNFNLYTDFLTEPHCPNCGGTDLVRRGFAYTSVSKYQRFVCNDCGKWSRGRTTDMDKYERKKIVVST